MTKKAKISIAAAVSAALLFGGIIIFFKDDIAQKKADRDILPYRPTPEIQHELDVISADLMTEVTTALESASPETVTSVVEDTAAAGLPDELRQNLIDSAQSLNSAYPNAIGWLYIPNTRISYPVMQGEDNEYYLHHDFDGSRLEAGSVFLDCCCENRLMNPINVLYGHNMRNGSMFAQVTSYTTDSFFDAHRYGWLATPDTVYRIDFFSCAIADSSDSLYDGSTPSKEWIPLICEKSVVSRDMTFSDNDRFISLSTCSYEFENARTVLTGKLVNCEEVDKNEYDDKDALSGGIYGC